MSFLDRLRQLLGLRPPAAPPTPPPPPFAWSAAGRVGEVGYALREAVRDRLGPAAASPTKEAWKAFLLDVDLAPDDGAWRKRDTLYANPREGDWTKTPLPDEAVVLRVDRLADDATTVRLPRGTRLGYRGASVDPTEGLEGDLYEILEGDRSGELIYLGNGGRLGAGAWAAATTLMPGGCPALDDATLPDELLALMRAVALEHGAPGFSG